VAYSDHHHGEIIDVVITLSHLPGCIKSMDRLTANELLWQIKDAITAMWRSGLHPQVVMMDRRLHKRLELGLDCGPIDAITKIPVCPVPGYVWGWKVVTFSGGLH